MLFNVDSDDGTEICGWIAPLGADAPPPRLVVIIPGRAEIEIDATPRPDAGDAARIYDFALDASVLPDIESAPELSIFAARERLLIYRRFQIARDLQRKLVLLDNSVMPQRNILSTIERHFSLSYFAAEQYPPQTIDAIVANTLNKSVVIAGRVSYPHHAAQLEKGGYLRVAILRAPLEELAERLLFLNILSRSKASHLASVFATDVEPLVDFAKDLAFDDPRALLSAFRAISDEQRQALISPMVRMLGCESGEIPQRRHVTSALDNLSTMDVVGLRENYRVFRALLSHTLGANILGAEEPQAFPSVKPLAAALSRIGIVTDMLRHDLTLYDLAQSALTEGES